MAKRQEGNFMCEKDKGLHGEQKRGNKNKQRERPDTGVLVVCLTNRMKPKKRGENRDRRETHKEDLNQ